MSGRVAPLLIFVKSTAPNSRGLRRRALGLIRSVSQKYRPEFEGIKTRTGETHLKRI